MNPVHLGGGQKGLFFIDFFFFFTRYVTKDRFQFRKKTLGYDTANVTAAKALESLFNHLQTTTKWYPGEGEPVIDFLMTVTTFLQTSYNLADLDRASGPFDSILTMLLKNDSIVSEKVRTRCNGSRSLTAENRWIFRWPIISFFEKPSHPIPSGPMNTDINRSWMNKKKKNCLPRYVITVHTPMARQIFFHLYVFFIVCRSAARWSK